MSRLDHVLRVTGATARQIDYWVRRGYLHPVGQGGTGNAFEWPQAEVRAATMMKVLTDSGVTPEAAARAARNDGLLASGPPAVRVIVEGSPPGVLAPGGDRDDRK